MAGTKDEAPAQSAVKRQNRLERAEGSGIPPLGDLDGAMLSEDCALIGQGQQDFEALTRGHDSFGSTRQALIKLSSGGSKPLQRNGGGPHHAWAGDNGCGESFPVGHAPPRSSTNLLATKTTHEDDGDDDDDTDDESIDTDGENDVSWAERPLKRLAALRRAMAKDRQLMADRQAREFANSKVEQVVDDKAKALFVKSPASEPFFHIL